MKDHNKEIRSLTESVNNLYEAPLHENTDMWALAEFIKHLYTLMDWENAFGLDRPIWDPDTGEHWPVPRLSPADLRRQQEKALQSTAGDEADSDF